MDTTKIFRFYSPTRIIEVEASSISEAKRKFQLKLGYFPDDKNISVDGENQN